MFLRIKSPSFYFITLAWTSLWTSFSFFMEPSLRFYIKIPVTYFLSVLSLASISLIKLFFKLLYLLNLTSLLEINFLIMSLAKYVCTLLVALYIYKIDFYFPFEVCLAARFVYMMEFLALRCQICINLSKNIRSLFIALPVCLFFIYRPSIKFCFNALIIYRL